MLTTSRTVGQLRRTLLVVETAFRGRGSRFLNVVTGRATIWHPLALRPPLKGEEMRPRRASSAGRIAKTSLALVGCALVVSVGAGRGSVRGLDQAAAGVSAPVVEPSVAHDTSPPLRDLIATGDVGAPPPIERENESPDSMPPDTLSQTDPLFAPSADPPNPFGVLESFEGISTAGLGVVTDCTQPNSCWPADASGAVGPNKSGTNILGPASSAAFWSGFFAPCTFGWTDEVVDYDHAADRWVVTRFAQDPSTNWWYECFAVSKTPDPTGSYYRYAFLISKTEFNDYEKLGIWPDAYYLTAQRNKIFPGLGLFVAAFERSKMLQGQPAQAVVFTLDNNGHRAGMLPADWDGQTAPPANAPNYLIRPTASALGWPGPDALELWQFKVDWSTPAASTLTLAQTLLPAPYQPACGFNQSCIPQPSTSTRLDPLASGYLMYRLAYRNFGSHQALVLNQTVDTGDLTPEVHAAVRWYELRSTGGAWSIYQQGDYAPDADNRWIGSIAMDRAGDIALGYNVSGFNRYPSIAFAGRTPGDPLGTLSNETALQSGGGSQTGFIFWSDYSQLTVDPTDDCTFWYVNGYQPTTTVNQGWATHIASFRSPSCPKATTALTYTGATAADFNDGATLSATLTNTFNGLPLQGEPLTFGLDGQSCMATTNAAGHAACQITPNEPAGNYPLTVSFAGTTQLEATNLNGTFVVNHEETTLAYTGPTLIANGSSIQLSGLLREDGTTPILGRKVDFTLGSGPGSQVCSGFTNLGGVATCTISPVAQPLGPDTVSATFGGDVFYRPATANADLLLFAFLANGAFVIGDLNATGAVTFWSSSWSILNAMTDGAAPAAFKGFAAQTGAPPSCGNDWTTTPGASSKPPDAVPSYMAVLVASSIAKSGATISGNTPAVVIVKTDPGYNPAPGHVGTGTVEASLCP